jgi:hypothetical protein
MDTIATAGFAFGGAGFACDDDADDLHKGARGIPSHCLALASRTRENRVPLCFFSRETSSTSLPESFSSGSLLSRPTSRRFSEQRWARWSQWLAKISFRL